MNTLIIIISALILLVVVLNIIAPKSYHVYRAIEINQPTSKVWEHIKYLRKQQEWSPWAEKDPEMEHKIIGTDGEIGAISYWNGNKEVGEGKQEITRIFEGKRMEQDLRFLKPFKSQSDCYIELEEIDSSRSRVIWGFKGTNKFPMTIMMLFMSMDKMVGKDFEQGLENLRHNLEQSS